SLSRASEWGQDAVHGPLRRHLPASRPAVVGQGHAPVVAVLVPAVKKALETVAAPKVRGSWTPAVLTCKEPYSAPGIGTAMLIMTPVAGTSCEGGRRPAAVVAVLIASVQKGRRVHPCPQGAAFSLHNGLF